MPALPSSLPHSEECERAILGAILLDPSLLSGVAVSLRATDFYIPKHQAIFTAMLATSPLDMRTLQVELERCGAFEQVGGLGYLVALDLDLPDLGRLDHYVGIVRNLSVKRSLVSVSEKLRLAASNGVPAQEVLDMVLDDLRAAQNDVYSSRQRPLELDEAVHRYVDSLEASLEATEPARGAKTGTLIDSHLAAGFFERGCLHIIGGDPEVGKTQLATQIYSGCIDDGVPALFLSNEMIERRALELLISHRLQIDSRLLARGRLPQATWSALVQEARRLKGKGLAPINRVGNTWAQIANELRQQVEERGLEVVLLDHLLIAGLLAAGPGEREHARVNRLCAAIVKDAITLKLAVIALTHLSRDSRKQGRRPNKADLREGGEGWAETVLLVHRFPVEGQGVLGPRGELILDKNRGGPPGVAPVIFNGATATWLDDNGG